MCKRLKDQGEENGCNIGTGQVGTIPGIKSYFLKDF